MSSRLPKSDSRKPDPDEPWRYISPCCELQVEGEQFSKVYRCNKCGKSYEKHGLIDKKGRIQS